MDMYIPASLIDNMNVIISNQNINLITAIAEWKGWNKEELIQEFMDETIDLVNPFEEISKGNESANIEVRYRTPWKHKSKKYLLESISDNVYSLDGTFIGKKFDDDLITDVEED